MKRKKQIRDRLSVSRGKHRLHRKHYRHHCRAHHGGSKGTGSMGMSILSQLYHAIDMKGKYELEENWLKRCGVQPKKEK